MCLNYKEINDNKRFIQHNVYFLAWLVETKKNVILEKVCDKNFHFIKGITNDEYKVYKKEYKEHKKLLKNISLRVKELQ